MKKSFTIGTLVGLSLCAVMLILSVLGISFFKGVKFDLLLTVATLTAGSYFITSSSEVLKRRKLLGIISTSLIVVAVIFVITTIWMKTGSVFGDLTLSFALLSILFNFIVSTKLKLGNKNMYVQVGCYSVLSIFIFICILSTFGVLKISKILSIFLILLILSVVSFIVVSVLSNKSNNYEIEEFVKITKKEYLELKEKAEKYDKLKVK